MKKLDLFHFHVAIIMPGLYILVIMVPDVS